MVSVPSILPSLRGNRSGRSVVGLDIEAGGVHAAEVTVNGRIAIERAAGASLEPGVVRDGEVVDPEALAGTLRELFDEHGFGKRVRVGVANQRIVMRVLDLPPLENPAELAVAVRFQAADQLPMPIGEAVLDHVSLGIVDTPEGPRHRVVLVAARREAIERLVAAVEAAGLRAEGVDLAAFAMVRAVASAGATGSTLCLAVGGVVNLAVARDGQCTFARVIGGGLEAMAVELAERQAIPVDEARAALAAVDLREPASSGDEPDEPEAPADPAREQLLSGVRRLAGEVRNSIDFHLAGEMTAERVVLTGPAAGIAGFAEVLGQMLALPVELGWVEAPDGVDPHRFSVAAGLAVEEAPA